MENSHPHDFAPEDSVTSTSEGFQPIKTSFQSHKSEEVGSHFLFRSEITYLLPLYSLQSVPSDFSPL